MKSDRNKTKLQIVKHYCLSIFSCILLVGTVFFGVGFNAAQPAVASPIDGYSQVIAANPIRGVGDQMEGEAEQALGKAQQRFGDGSTQLDGAGKEVEGLAKQAKGNVKQGIEKTKSAADQASDKVEQKSENLLDAVKDFFD